MPPRRRGGPEAEGSQLISFRFFCGSCMQLRPRSLPGNAKQCPRTVGASPCGRSLHWRESSSPSAEAHRLDTVIVQVEGEMSAGLHVASPGDAVAPAIASRTADHGGW